MNSSQPDSPLLTIAYHQDPLAVIAELVAQQYADDLPNLTHLTILLSTPFAISAQRQKLIQVLQGHGVQAVLGPHISTLPLWVNQHPLPTSDNISQIISDQARELLLVEALKEFPAVTNNSNPWQLAACLIPLFDDLTRYHVVIPDSIDAFIEQLSQAYGVNDQSMNALNMEASLVHRLWRAMQMECLRLKVIDQTTAYMLRLQHSLSRMVPEQHFILAGQFDLIPAEIDWLSVLLGRGQVTLINQSGSELNPREKPAAKNTSVLTTTATWQSQLEEQSGFQFKWAGTQSSASDFFQQVFDTESAALLQRSASLLSRYSVSPIDQGIQVFAAANAEEEARAVDVRLRQWILEGRKRIALVTENRRLARRVRALLERANVILHDASGWALSTTSAATVIERWFECIEQDFHHHALLDFLKSPFVSNATVESNAASVDNENDSSVNAAELASDFLTIVHRFEQGVVIHENIASGLQRYRQHTQFRIQRVSSDMQDYYAGIIPLLETLENAAQPLQTLFKQNHATPLAYLDALEQGLNTLGVWQGLANDAAGELIIDLCQQLRHSCHYTRFTMSWIDFRTWLGQTLEHAHFIPGNRQYHVQLYTLAQTDLQDFDGVVVAAAEMDYLPATTAPSPFFNDGVRSALGIPGRVHGGAQQFRLFRRLLESSDDVFITRRHSDDGEEIMASPWLEAIQTFHRLAYGNDLADSELGQLLQDPACEVTLDTQPLPSTVKPNPASGTTPELIPKTISATAYQQLMDCPYQFFAARCLQLVAPDAVRELLEKDDYGNRVHRCLEAFHTDIPGVDGPFSSLINETNRDAAISMLQNISRQIFSRDIENNFLHRGWLKQWLSVIPDYIDWQIKRNVQWRVSASERRYKDVALESEVYITGILDRIDEHAGQRAIVDYKTGYVPPQEAIDEGEAVQLPFYVMLAQAADVTAGLEPRGVQRAEYLSLSNTDRLFGSRGFLEGQLLHEVTQQNHTRLVNVITELRQGTEMTAWGDHQVCHYCRFDGLCRKQLWDTVLGDTVSEKTVAETTLT